MNKYENMIASITQKDVEIIEYNFMSHRIKGLCCDNKIAINSSINTTEKTCVLAEELGHYYTTVGDIIDQASVNNRKQELHARIWAYNKLIGLYGIIDCYKAGCHNLHDMAEHLDVTEAFLNDSLQAYHKKYGIFVRFDNYFIYFEPNLNVLEIM